MNEMLLNYRLSFYVHSNYVVSKFNKSAGFLHILHAFWPRKLLSTSPLSELISALLIISMNNSSINRSKKD